VADIAVQNLTKYYGDRLILQDISFDIQAGEKVAVLGANGAGKTTLLHILTGRLAYEGGHVSLGAGKTVGIIDQMPTFPPHATVNDVLRLAFWETDELMAALEQLSVEMAHRPNDTALLKRYATLEARLDVLGGYNRDFEIDRVCNGLAIPPAMREQAFAQLSGGEKTRINLARIILERTDILLLDEPTNHLDMESVNWLGNYLENYHGTVLTISHDRWFLDQCCTRIIEIRDGKVDFYYGNYSYYAVERERRRAEQLKRHENELAEKKRLEATARSMHEHGTEHLAKRAASIEKRIARMKVTDRPPADKRMSVRFGDPNYETEDVLQVRGLSKSFGSRCILDDISFHIRNRERVAILGANGAGKTTLLKLLLGEEKPDAGVIRKGVGLRPAYLPQQVYFANPHRNLIDTLIYDKNVTAQTARNRLGAFQFTGEEQLKTVEILSGGEKSRLRLCELLYDPLNLLILDEPTNHLDLASREWMEAAVAAFDGTLLFVSHDRYFVERFATRILYMENAHILDFLGTYSDFLAWRENNPALVAASLSGTDAASASGATSGAALRGMAPASEAPSAKKRHKPAAPTLDDVPPPPVQPKRTGGTKQLQKQLNMLEREIAQLERDSATLEQEMLEAASDSARLLELLTQKEQQEERLTARLEEWEAVAAELEERQS